MGFIFKVMPDSYFDKVMKDSPQLNIEYHDEFLAKLAASETENLQQKLKDKIEKKEPEPLDLTKFVKLLEFNRRWTY